MRDNETASILAAVRETLNAIPRDPRDAALRSLVKQYAIALDRDGDLEHLGSRLLSALEALNATPRARKGEAPATGPSALDRFRDAAAAR